MLSVISDYDVSKSMVCQSFLRMFGANVMLIKCHIHALFTQVYLEIAVRSDQLLNFGLCTVNSMLVASIKKIFDIAVVNILPLTF